MILQSHRIPSITTAKLSGIVSSSSLSTSSKPGGVKISLPQNSHCPRVIVTHPCLTLLFIRIIGTTNEREIMVMDGAHPAPLFFFFILLSRAFFFENSRVQNNGSFDEWWCRVGGWVAVWLSLLLLSAWRIDFSIGWVFLCRWSMICCGIRRAVIGFFLHHLPSLFNIWISASNLRNYRKLRHYFSTIIKQQSQNYPPPRVASSTALTKTKKRKISSHT